MRILPILALLCIAVGCGSSEPAAHAPADSREAERAEIRSRINARQQELDQANADLAKIASERESLSKAEASESKNNRLVELARLESDTKQKQATLSSEIAQLEQQLGGPAPAPVAKPKSASDSLDDLIAGNDGSKEKEEAERRKQKAVEEAAADKARIAQAETARKAELDERAKQQVEGGRLQANADGPGYEERWADVINKVRTELQKFKRW